MTHPIMKKSKFEKALDYLFPNEGGFNDHPNDKGGATNFGISLRFLKDHHLDINEDGLINIDDIKDLTKEKSSEIYYKKLWLPSKAQFLQDERLAIKYFDMVVNMYFHQAVLILQRAINQLNHEQIEEDGKIGVKTLNAANYTNSDALLLEIWYQLTNFYKGLAKKDKKNKVFLDGWLNRAKRMPPHED